jgi:hypothetical protein
MCPPLATHALSVCVVDGQCGHSAGAVDACCILLLISQQHSWVHTVVAWLRMALKHTLDGCTAPYLHFPALPVSS